MKLKECKIGTLVYTDDDEIGHIVGLTHNIGFKTISQMTFSLESLKDRVVPLVKFVGDEIPRGIHHHNLKIVNW